MKAFTLMETLLVVFIISALIGLIVLFIINLANFNVFFILNIGGAREIDITLNNMIKELRSMNQSNTGGYPIEEASQSRIVFYTDLDGDGIMERVRYFLENNQVKRGVTRFTQNTYDLSKEKIWTMISNVSKFQISYYDRNFTGIEPPLPFPVDISKIRVIKIDVSLKFFNKPEIHYYIIATPRNLRGK